MVEGESTAESTDAPRRLAHQPALDGLRGLAVAAVLLFHGGHLTGGYLGVDAFFVLSGFLITSLLLGEIRDDGAISLRAFWERRARRLLPALGVVLLAVAAYAAFVAKPDELATIRGDALATIAYVANWRSIIVGNDYWALFRAASPLQHTWSLAIEEQFYFLWPLIVVALVRGRGGPRAAKRIFVASVGLCLASFLWAQFLFDPNDTLRVYYGTDTRIASILVGAALAAWLAVRGPVAGGTGRRLLESLGFVSVAGLAVAWTHLSGTSNVLYRGGLLACAIATAVVIAASVHPERGVLSRVLSAPPLRALGLISYGVYLWHWPIYVFLDSSRAHLTGWPLLAIRIAITLGISYVSFRFVERPIRRGAGSRKTLLRLAPAVAAALVVVVIASTWSASTPEATATTSSFDGRGGVLLVGDSVASSFFAGLVNAGVKVHISWSAGCRFLAGELPFSFKIAGNCDWEKAWRGAVQAAQPAVVVMMIGALDLFDLKPPGATTFLQVGTPEWNQYFTRELGTAIDTLGSTGAKVVIPTWPCISAPEGAPGFRTHPSALDVERVRDANRLITRVVAQHRATATSPDLFSFLCPAGAYQRDLASVPVVRGDGIHYTPAGANLVARWLLSKLIAVAPKASLTFGPRKPLAIVYGDSLAYEASPTISKEVAAGGNIDAVVHAAPGLALCNMTQLLVSDLGSLHPFAVVLETHGGSSADCMTDSAGKQLRVGSRAYYEKYGTYFHTFFAEATAVGAKVVFVETPPERTAAADNVQRNLAAIARTEARTFPGVEVNDSPRLALGGSTWSPRMPCLPSEGDNVGCNGGSIVVRSPDGAYFCPVQPASAAAVTNGCPTYSSGAVRYGRAIAALLTQAARATPKPSG